MIISNRHAGLGASVYQHNQTGLEFLAFAPSAAGVGSSQNLAADDRGAGAVLMADMGGQFHSTGAGALRVCRRTMRRSRRVELLPAGGRRRRPRPLRVVLLVAAAVLAVPAGAAGDPPSRAHPVPYSELTLRFDELRVKQGGQRVHVVIPVDAGTDQFGDAVTYRWDTHVSGGPRCQPGRLPDLGEVTAGTVIDAPLPMPPGGWCRGLYGVTLNAIITLNCGSDPPPGCRSGRRITDRVADAPFDVAPPTTVCHRRGEVERCWHAPTLRDAGGWNITAPLDDLLGPEGATADADRFFERAFHDHPIFQRDWETDDDTFYGWATRRRQAARMAAIVDRVLRAGPYYGKRWPGRPKA